MREIKLRKDRGSPVPPNPLEPSSGGNEVPLKFPVDAGVVGRYPLLYLLLPVHFFLREPSTNPYLLLVAVRHPSDVPAFTMGGKSIAVRRQTLILNYLVNITKSTSNLLN